MRQYLERHPVSGRALVPGCGRGHEVALALEHGLDATGLDIAPTGIAEARIQYPKIAERFVVGDLFDPPAEMRGAFDVVLEHTCIIYSALQYCEFLPAAVDAALLWIEDCEGVL